jgi:hypothetical protein
VIAAALRKLHGQTGLAVGIIAAAAADASVRIIEAPRAVREQRSLKNGD